MNDPETYLAALLADATAALESSQQDTTAPGLVVTIGLRGVVRELERIQRAHAYEKGITDGTVKRLWT